MSTEHLKLIVSGGVEEVVYFSHELRAAITFRSLKDANKGTPVVPVGVEVESFFNTAIFRGDVAGRVRICGAAALVIHDRERLKRAHDLELPSDCLAAYAADDSLAFL
jgi:hypothetical protein